MNEGSIRFACSVCSQRLEASQDLAGKVVRCPSCHKTLTVPPPVAASPLPRTAASQATDQVPLGLTFLLVCAVLHAFLSTGVAAIGLGTQNPVSLVGGVVSCGFYAAIAGGLWKQEQWARYLLIWMSWVGIFTGLVCSLASPLMMLGAVPMVGFEILTLVLAFLPSVREVIAEASVPRTYIYHETA